MRIRPGQIVRGRDFFKRDKEVARLWKKIENGNSILISAPRRVGKTSLMRYIEDNPKEDYLFIYIITESVSSEKEYYKRLYKKLVEEDVITSIKTKLISSSKAIISKISEIGKSIKIDSDKELDYYKELNSLIKNLDIDNLKLIIMIDEFPQTLENIINEHGNNSALHFLQTNRELRQNTEISDKVQFIYTGSIGLENIVSRINAINLINDIEIFNLQPLSEIEVKELIRELTLNLNFKLKTEIVNLILEKIKWYIPYYIQIVLDQIDNINDEKNLEYIDESTIEEAFKRLLDQRIYFEHWYKRLDKSYKDNDYKFAKQLLNSICEVENFSKNDALNLATGLNIQDKYRDIVKALEHDGYIHLENNSYIFNSPLLRIWWLESVAS